MTSYYTITVRNNSSTTQYFYVFQKQATFQPVVGVSSIMSGSLGCQAVNNYQSSGAQISFSLSADVYVGAISTAPPLPPSQSMASASASVSIPPTSTKAVWQIQLTSASSTSALNSTTLTISPLGLSVPANKSGISVGAFGISVPPYTPTPNPNVYCGVASVTSSGSELLSSFIAPTPNATVMCSPEPIYFVSTGYMPEGEVVTYDETYAAKCDFTTGYTTIAVTYNSDGTFSTAGGS